MTVFRTVIAKVSETMTTEHHFLQWHHRSTSKLGQKLTLCQTKPSQNRTDYFCKWERVRHGQSSFVCCMCERPDSPDSLYVFPHPPTFSSLELWYTNKPVKIRPLVCGSHHPVSLCWFSLTSFSPDFVLVFPQGPLPIPLLSHCIHRNFS